MVVKGFLFGLFGGGLWLGATAASAQVLSLDADGHVTVLCTAAQNAHAAPVAPMTTTPAVYAPMIARAAQAYQLAPDLLDTLIREESGYDAGAVSKKGAVGLTQLMPATAKALGVDPYDPQQNIMGGAALLRHLLDAYDGHIDLALAGYNAGQGAVAKYGAMPPYAETREYVGQNLANLAAISENAVHKAGQAPINADNYIQSCQTDTHVR